MIGCTGTGSNQVALVSAAPLSRRAMTALGKALRKVGPPEQFLSLNLDDVGDFTPYIQSYNIKVVVALGAEVFHRLTISTIPIEKARGYRYESDYGCAVMPTYSPEIVSRGKMNLVPVLIWDLRRALAEVSLGPVEFPMDELVLQPGPGDFKLFCAEAMLSPFIAVDLETIDSGDDDEDSEAVSFTIVRASAAIQCEGKPLAVTWPWQQPFTEMFEKLMAEHRGAKVFWNGQGFDLPRLREVGIVPAGELVDAMWLAHFLVSTLPRSLGHRSTYYTRIPEWKSIGAFKGTDDELYSACDAWATAKCYLGICAALAARSC